MLRKIITALIGGGTAVLATLTLTAAPLSASPGGPDPVALGDHGWGCIDAVHAVHCAPPGIAPKIGTAPAIPVLVFDTRNPPTSGPFLGTEFNIAPAQFHGQPCPTDPPSQQYTFLPDIGFPLPYYACHRFDSPLP